MQIACTLTRKESIENRNAALLEGIGICSVRLNLDTEIYYGPVAKTCNIILICICYSWHFSKYLTNNYICTKTKFLFVFLDSCYSQIWKQCDEYQAI